MSGATVALDAGHNGANAAHSREINRLVDAGGFRKACDTTGTATNDGRLAEHAFNFDVVRRTQAELRDGGAKVVLTRTTNSGVGPCINVRAAIGNRSGADAAISVHADGAGASAHGFHVISMAPRRARSARVVRASRRLAIAVRDALVAAGLKPSTYAGSRGLVVRDDVGGLNLSIVPKVLVELGNMRNAADARAMKTAAFRQRVARAFARAIARFTG